MSSSASPLFQPIRVGNVDLQHRIVMAPLTRQRADKDHVHGEIAKTYYEQRAGTPGTLIISEATFIAPQAGGIPHVPGIWNDAQIAGWKAVTDAVHAKGSYMFLQLWALGRGGYADVLKQEGPYDLVAPSAISHPAPGAPPVVPRALTAAEIEEYVALYAQAARNAIAAGFDGVEVHSANGYLLDQFLQPASNTRTDAYGGSIENRVRFPLAVVDAVVRAVGAARTGLRVSPWNHWLGMGMEDPEPTLLTLVERVRDTYPDFAYLHAVEPRIDGPTGDAELTSANARHSNAFLRRAWGARPYIAAGGFTHATATEAVQEHGGLVAFGRHFISNPDLPLRLKENLALNPYSRATFFGPVGSAEGYTDYPFTSETVSPAVTA